jgi:hypothetical protein
MCCELKCCRQVQPRPIKLSAVLILIISVGACGTQSALLRAYQHDNELTLV